MTTVLSATPLRAALAEHVRSEDGGASQPKPMSNGQQHSWAACATQIELIDQIEVMDTVCRSIYW